MVGLGHLNTWALGSKSGSEESGVCVQTCYPHLYIALIGGHVCVIVTDRRVNVRVYLDTDSDDEVHVHAL